MTEVSTTAPATSIKQISTAPRLTINGQNGNNNNILHYGGGWLSKISSNRNLQSLISNYNSTAQLQKNLMFPSIKKSISLLNLRAKVRNHKRFYLIILLIFYY